MKTILAAVLVILIAPAAVAKTRATRSSRAVVAEWTVPQCQTTGLPWLR